MMDKSLADIENKKTAKDFGDSCSVKCALDMLDKGKDWSWEKL